MDTQLNMIFDRTQDDVDRVSYLANLWTENGFTGTTAELAEWATDLKGAYNATDLNRVIAAMDYLNEYFLGLGYDVGYTKIAVPHQQGGGGGILPSGYTQLEYIQSSGTQYVNTGFTQNQNSRVVMDAQAITITGNAWLFEGRLSSASSSHGILWYSTFDKWCADYNGNRYSFSTLMPTDRLFIDYNKNVIDINGETHTFSESSFSSEYSLALFACNTAGNVTGYVVAKLYSCKIYDNENLIRDFIPCKNPSNSVGLYDIVNSKFYSNSGSGAFTAGPEIEIPEQDQYTWYETDIPTQNEMSIYIEDVSRLRDKIPLLADTPETPDDMQLLTYQEANDIERILDNIERVLIAMENGFLLRQANTLFMIAGGVFNNA